MVHIICMGHHSKSNGIYYYFPSSDNSLIVNILAADLEDDLKFADSKSKVGVVVKIIQMTNSVRFFSKL